jgi:hypothetical protein
LRSTTRSLSGMSALSVILMCSGQTSVQHLVFLVVTHDVAGVLAEEALDALAELLRALDVDLGHPVVPGGQVGRWRERGDLPGLPGDQGPGH